ncbi:MAG: undecaprenyldiphospho-muramoylpentapeptide beta-N-acetylglucosaminyltransferase [Elusimicrobiota bacterium]|nr:undecaprenyldiphospho-muramoylpentapeptide beta-N-acetylglucosaminyltransferase [Elusimicrobiota bacterium]
MKRVIIAAGGTGGHFYPGLVASRELRVRGWECLFIVRRDDPNKEKLQAESVPFVEADLRGLPRSLSLDLLRFPLRLAGAQRLMTKVVRDFRPDLVVGMGGYLTFPLVLAARCRRVPAALHESNSVLGLANRASALLGAEVYWGLPPREGGGAVVGTPVRAELLQLPAREDACRRFGLDPAKPVLLVFGGSQGAQALNRGVPLALRALPSHPQVLHLAGRGKAEETARLYGAAPAVVRDYTEDMAAAYAAADLVVCRSGASTLSELAATRKPAVLVPYPHAADDHQTANARVFQAAGAAVLLPESALERKLGGVVSDVLKSRLKDTMAAAYARLELPDARTAAKAFVDALEKTR